MNKITHIYKKVMTLDLSQNFVFTQYPQDELMEFNNMLHTL